MFHLNHQYLLYQKNWLIVLNKKNIYKHVPAYQYIKKREKRRKSENNIILFSENVEYIFECIKKCVKIEHVLEARATTKEFQIIQKSCWH